MKHVHQEGLDFTCFCLVAELCSFDRLLFLYKLGDPEDTVHFNDVITVSLSSAEEDATAGNEDLSSEPYCFDARSASGCMMQAMLGILQGRNLRWFHLALVDIIRCCLPYHLLRTR